ncbi:MAG TPA: hypothetical protein VIT41_09560 [Microlunatus sp.]
MSRRTRDGSERLLAVATTGLPARRAEWGAAMRAELAAIDDVGARRRFARSAAAVALGRGYGVCLVLASAAALFVAGATLTASRVQLHDGGPGVLAVTVPVPAVPLLVIAFLAARMARSFGFGLVAGVLGLLASLAAVFGVLALEGPVWMARYGVFMLDADPPRHAVGSAEIVLDLFSTGMWIGHVAFWLPWLLIGAALGARLGSRTRPTTAAR